MTVAVIARLATTSAVAAAQILVFRESAPNDVRGPVGPEDNRRLILKFPNDMALRPTPAPAKMGHCIFVVSLYFICDKRAKRNKRVSTPFVPSSIQDVRE
jgi:hypothetical protein